MKTPGKRDINNALKAAKDFGFPQEVVEEIKNAKTIGELNSVMRKARAKYIM